MKKLALILFLGILITGCKGSKSSSNLTIQIGVPACDEYLGKVEILINNPNVPQTIRDKYKQSLEQNRTAWKQATTTEQGKQQLESSCKTALDLAKSAFIQYGQK